MSTNEDQLVEMGFDREKAQSALKRANGDIEQAMNFLFDPPHDDDDIPDLLRCVCMCVDAYVCMDGFIENVWMRV